MKTGIRFRLTVLALGLGLMGALIVAVTLTSQYEAGETKARLGHVDLESFRIADLFKEKLRYANDKMRRYASFRDAGVWEEFLNAADGLKTWIAREKPLLATRREQQVLKQMELTWDGYVQKAREVDALMKKAGESGASLAEYSEFLGEARHFMDLGQELARAHYESRSQILAQANRTLTQLRLSVLGLVAMLFLFGAALAFVVSRSLITPLRTQLFETEAHALRNEKLASLGLLAAGVAHEIRTPLTAIKASLFLQKKGLQTGTPERKEAEVIEREIVRLERVVTDFLQFGRPMEPQLSTVLADLPLERVRELLSTQLASAGIELIHERSGSGPPIRIRIDSGQVQQVLINLVQNAADNVGRNGAITLRARGERGRLQNGETDLVILEVADNGKGMPPEVERRLFDPFFTTKPNGTGLGLSIAARIVEKHGGRLQYQTQPNHGTTFGVVLPEAKA